VRTNSFVPSHFWTTCRKFENCCRRYIATCRNFFYIGVRYTGQCSVCLRHLSLTSNGSLYKHGPGPGCSGSGQAPVSGSVSEQCRYVPVHRDTPSSSLTASSTATTSQAAGQSLQPSPAVDTSPQSTDVDLLELLRRHRCRVVKCIPKGVRVHAADKLERLLSVVCEDLDNIVSWKNLLLFTFCCFAVPGQRGGKRHSSTLASKMNKRCAW